MSFMVNYKDTFIMYLPSFILFPWLGSEQNTLLGNVVPDKRSTWPVRRSRFLHDDGTILLYYCKQK